MRLMESYFRAEIGRSRLGGDIRDHGVARQVLGAPARELHRSAQARHRPVGGARSVDVVEALRARLRKVLAIVTSPALLPEQRRSLDHPCHDDQVLEIEPLLEARVARAIGIDAYAVEFVSNAVQLA